MGILVDANIDLISANVVENAIVEATVSRLAESHFQHRYAGCEPVRCGVSSGYSELTTGTSFTATDIGGYNKQDISHVRPRWI